VPRSLRGQLVLAFTGFALVVVVAAAVATVLLMRHAVWAPLDAALEEEAETLDFLVGQEAADLSEVAARIGSETELGPGKFVRVIGPDGAVLVSTGEVPAVLDRPELPRASEETAAKLGDGRGAYRVVWHPGPGGLWTEIGVSAHGRLRALRHATSGVAAGAVALLGILVALAWVVTGRATGELQRLAGELETVEAGSLHRRLAPRRTTEVDRLAAVLNRLLERLEGALGHLRRFTADAAHELRTPIAALRAHIEVALAPGRSAEAYRDGLLDALEQTERLGRLAADLLTLSSVEGGSVANDVVRLDAVAREVADFLEPVAQEQGRPFVCRTERAVSVRGGADLLKRLVLNLVDNAFRHTRPDAAVEVSVRADDGMAAIEVRDQGSGIEEHDVEGLFERFHRGNTATAGTGLGLALCREIAVRHGGSIALSSTPGAGTIVTVVLPLA